MPSSQYPTLGVHVSSNSGAAQSTRTYASPTLGSIVVNGYAPSGTSFIVAALNSVDFPTEGLPTRPMR
ncbi:hypothetical protein SY89_02829 [Halolamina pelagica]|uniref:Uncharacterized protein n=1 Tax=Halolamina pelagica TaxID=699431 RepID=A0A0P7FXU9_9EURY|nr:hypothetical protein SY89_02829 [Halolamina pelagica]